MLTGHKRKKETNGSVDRVAAQLKKSSWYLKYKQATADKPEVNGPNDRQLELEALRLIVQSLLESISNYRASIIHGREFYKALLCGTGYSCNRSPQRHNLSHCIKARASDVWLTCDTELSEANLQQTQPLFLGNVAAFHSTLVEHCIVGLDGWRFGKKWQCSTARTIKSHEFLNFQ